VCMIHSIFEYSIITFFQPSHSVANKPLPHRDNNTDYTLSEIDDNYIITLELDNGIKGDIIEYSNYYYSDYNYYTLLMDDHSEIDLIVDKTTANVSYYDENGNESSSIKSVSFRKAKLFSGIESNIKVDVSVDYQDTQIALKGTLKRELKNDTVVLNAQDINMKSGANSFKADKLEVVFDGESYYQDGGITTTPLDGTKKDVEGGRYSYYTISGGTPVENSSKLEGVKSTKVENLELKLVDNNNSTLTLKADLAFEFQELSEQSFIYAEKNTHNEIVKVITYMNGLKESFESNQINNFNDKNHPINLSIMGISKVYDLVSQDLREMIGLENINGEK